MIKNEIASNTIEGKHLWKALKAGEAIPDEYMAKVISERLT
jgi:hypothetical protein